MTAAGRRSSPAVPRDPRRRRSPRCARARRSPRGRSPRDGRRRAALLGLAVVAARLRRCSADRRRHPARAARARRRRARAVRRRRDALVAARRGRSRRSSGWPARRFGGAAGRARARERGPQPAPHGGDRGRADDRARAGHLRRRARRGPARLGRDAVDDAVDADYVVTAQNGCRRFAGGGRRRASRRHPASRSASSDPRGPARVIGETQVDVDGVDPKTIARRLPLRAGPRARTRVAARRSARDGAIVSESFADDHDLARRRACSSLRDADGQALTSRVAGIYDPPRFDPLLGGVVVAPDDVRPRVPAPAGHATLFVDGTPTAGRARAGARGASRTEVARRRPTFVEEPDRRTSTSS